MKLWVKFQKKFSIQSYEFTLFELLSDGFKIKWTDWLKLLLADLLLIIIIHLPVWNHQLLVWFPALKMLQINPNYLSHNSFVTNFFMVSKLVMPYLFTLFITVPVYLGVNLLALYIAYQKPASIKLLTHYINFAWWSVILSLGIYLGIILVPTIYIIKLISLLSVHPEYKAQFLVGLSVFGILTILFIALSSMTLQLIFAARLNVFDALQMSWKATSQRFKQILAILLIMYAAQQLSYYTHYLSDIFLMPPTMMAWALLYKRIFGEKGLVE